MMIAIFVLFFICLTHGVPAPPPVVDPEYLDMLRATGQDAEFAKLMRIEDVSLVRAQAGSSEKNIKASHLGDILLTPEQLEQSRQGLNFTKYPASKWPRNEIPYFISLTDYSFSQRSTINSAIRTLSNSLANLKLRPYRLGDSDYVMVISGNGCYSYLGKTGGSQTISLQRNGCLSSGTIQHEFIHAAGFVHEHNRPDRDGYVTVLFENIPDAWKSQYEIVSSEDYGIQEPYDYYSVMHYPLLAPETNLPAFDILDKTIDQSRIGQRQSPTESDIKKVNTLYS